MSIAADQTYCVIALALVRGLHARSGHPGPLDARFHHLLFVYINTPPPNPRPGGRRERKVPAAPVIRDEEQNELPQSGHYANTPLIWLKLIAVGGWVDVGGGGVLSPLPAVIATSITARRKLIYQQPSLSNDILNTIKPKLRGNASSFGPITISAMHHPALMPGRLLCFKSNERWG